MYAFCKQLTVNSSYTFYLCFLINKPQTFCNALLLDHKNTYYFYATHNFERTKFKESTHAVFFYAIPMSMDYYDYYCE